MEFLLSGYEGLIGFLIKSNVPKDRCCNERSNLFNLNIFLNTDGSTIIDVVG
jgi:hypothetical protein